jgi:hypothetical protein
MIDPRHLATIGFWMGRKVTTTGHHHLSAPAGAGVVVIRD